jgi:hypothetical protein
MYFGCLPVFRSRETTSLARIWFFRRWNCSGELRWLEQTRRFFCAGISFNKGIFGCLYLCKWLEVFSLLLASRGGEEKKCGGIEVINMLCSLAGRGGEEGSCAAVASSSSSPAKSATCRIGLGYLWRCFSALLLFCPAADSGGARTSTLCSQFKTV